MKASIKYNNRSSTHKHTSSTKPEINRKYINRFEY